MTDDYSRRQFKMNYLKSNQYEIADANDRKIK